VQQNTTNPTPRADACTSASTCSDACASSCVIHDTGASAVVDIFDDSIDIGYDFVYDVS